MTPIYRPLNDWPALAQAFAEDLANCRTHSEAVHLLEGLTHEEKSLIFQACPPELQRRLWQMKEAAA